MIKAGLVGGRDKADAHRLRGGVDLVVDAELAHGVLQVEIHRAFRDVQDGPDLLGGLARGGPLQNLDFALRERDRLGNLLDLHQRALDGVVKVHR